MATRTADKPLPTIRPMLLESGALPEDDARHLYEVKYDGWRAVDGRWISIGLAGGKRAGMAMVQNSGLLCEYVETFEDALALARRWRTT